MGSRGADLVAGALARAGARQLFALSGNHVMPIFDAALDTKLPIVHVRHEAAAVHMADAWGRLTGEPGIALVTGGPGHANAVGALYTALAADSPMLLLSGHAPTNELGKGAFQEMAQAEMAAPAAKASWTVRSADSLGIDLAHAFRTARSGRPGPVHLSLPVDLLEMRIGTDLPDQKDFLPEEHAADYGDILESLNKAKTPLLVAGPALGNARGRARLREFEEVSGVPAIVMESPRGVNDPGLGLLAEALRRADIVVLAGKQRDFTLKFGAAFAADCRILELGLPVDLPGISRGLTKARNGWRDDVRSMLAYRPPEWATVCSRPEGPLHPVELARGVQKLLDAPESVLVCDGGEFGQWAQATLNAPHRVINGPAGSIGAALPFAAAAKLALPGSRVVAMLGDGTFGFHCAEIDTAVRHGIAYLAVIGNDACWNAEHQIQLRSYGAARARGCELLPTRYDRVAEGFGAHAEHAERPAELGAALERAAGAGRVACVNARIERLPAPAYKERPA